MRKFLLFTIIVCQLTDTFGQTSDWGSWVQNPCFVGLYTRFKKSDIYSEKYGRTWYVQFKNTYPEKIAFSFTSGDNPNDINDNIANQKKGYRTELAANSIDDGLMWVSEFNEEQCILGIGLLRFLGINETDVSKLYANCRGGEFCNYCAIRPVPGCPNYSNSPKNNTSTQHKEASTHDKKDGSILLTSLKLPLNDASKKYIQFFEDLGYKLIKNDYIDGISQWRIVFDKFNVDMGGGEGEETAGWITIIAKNKEVADKLSLQIEFPENATFSLKEINYDMNDEKTAYQLNLGD